LAVAAMGNFVWAVDLSTELPHPATARNFPQVTVIAIPVEGLPPLNVIPSNVQTADRGNAKTAEPGSCDYLNNTSAASCERKRGNPFQLDINYHGFTALPLLGTPEGLSV